MARPIRVEFEDAVYHVTARGNERRATFRDDADRARFLETLEEACRRCDLVVHAYCLMPNHYHLLVQTPRANLSNAAGWIQTTYSIRFNRRHHRSGHLFQGRFKADLVEADAYARELIKYIHLNPVRPKDKRRAIPVERKSELRRYRFSSHRAYAGLVAAKTIPPWLCLDWLSYFGRTRPVAQAEYRRQIAATFGQVAASPFERLRGGLVLGGERLWQKALQCLRASPGQEELRFRQRADRQAVSGWIAAACEREADRRIQIWLRVELGGERQTDVAAAYGYRDGSGVHRVVERLESKARTDSTLQARLEAWRAELSTVKS
jgi:REP element-mobilizing transposase RayT